MKLGLKIQMQDRPKPRVSVQLVEQIVCPWEPQRAYSW